jgi:hypothetical protein
MPTRDDQWVAFWLEERDWLVEVVMVPDDNPEDAAIVLEWIGRVYAFSMATNTRMLAMIGDPDIPSYELWFSFDTENEKQQFLQFIREDGYADPDEENSFQAPPDLADIPRLQMITKVLPEHQLNRIMRAAMVMIATILAPPTWVN